MACCLVYCRVSTEEQAEKGYSLDTLEKLCRDFAERNAYRVAGVFRDEGRSGTTLDRPALQDLLAKCGKDTVIAAVIVQETDRLARNTHDHLTIRALLQKGGVKLISVAQPMLDDSPEGKMIDTILASVNQFQSDLSGRKVRKALQEKFNQGWWPALAPVGYVNVVIEGDSGGLRERRIIKGDPQSWPALREAFHLYLTGDYSAEELRDLLYDRGVRSKTGKKLPHSVMVRMLKSPFYAGLMVWNGQRKMGRHEPIITFQEHERILQILDSHNLHACRRRKHNFLLRGVVYSNLCGHRYTGEHHTSKKRAYYHCAARGEHSNLNQNVEIAELEQQVEEQFKDIHFRPEFAEAIVDRLKAVSADQRENTQAQKQALFNQQKALETKRDTAEEKLLTGILSDDAFVRMRRRLADQLDGIQRQLVTFNAQRECDTDAIRDILRMANDVYEAYKEAPSALKRQYLGLFWDQFLVEDKEIVEAIPSRLIREFQEAKAVILSSKGRACPTLIITLQDAAYMQTVREKLLAIRALQKEQRHVESHSARAA